MYRYLTYAVVVSLSFVAAWFCKPSPPLEFASVSQVKIVNQFLYEKMIFPNVLAVSTSPITDTDSFQLTAAVPSKGNVVIVPYNINHFPSKNCRIWGNVSAMGDSDLLDQLETIVRKYE